MVARVGVLASGSGSNLQALLDADLGDARIEVVLVNVPGARALERARSAGVPAVLVDHTHFPTRADFDAALLQALAPFALDWIVLAGFMRIITPVVLRAYPDRIVNIHPALLPSFPGIHAQAQALAAGVKVAGCTVHLVDEGTDTGPILAQAVVPVLDDDDEVRLSKRILEQEHALYPRAVRALCEGRLRFDATGPKRRAFLEGFGGTT